jgi:RHS repeat-associated protein
VVERISYSAYGESTGSSLTRYTYTGREEDEVTGLIYYRARWYDPSMGRFLLEDPIEFAGGSNWYAYVGNNPVNYTDPSGNIPAAIPVIIEGGSTAYDVYYTYSTLTDKCSDNIDKYLSGGGFALGVILPGGGYGKAAKITRGIIDRVAGTVRNFGKGLIGRISNFFGKKATKTTDIVTEVVDDKIDDALNAGKDANKPRFIVTPDGVAIPTNPDELKDGMNILQDVSTNPDTSRKFMGTDSRGPVRIRIEKAHPADPNFTGTPDPLHIVDHLHIDRRKNITTGPWSSKEKTAYEWPF